jgi:hypothetical protein
MKEGNINEFSTEYSDYFNEFETKFDEGPQKILLEKIPLWIKMLLIKKGLMCMETNRMDK